MKISTKGRYALRMLVDLAENQENGYVPLKDIANRQDISKKYLEQIVALLHRPGILLTNRGFQGGYRLAKEPKEYTVGDILRITEGSLSPVEDDGTDDSVTLPVWQGLSKVINEYLDSITLQDLLDRKRATYSYDYVI